MDTTKVEIVKSIVVDSIEYVKKSDVLQFYSDIADKQATQFTILISVLCGVVVVLLGATWWWNYRAAKQQIKDDINTKKKTLTRLLRNKLKEINTTIEKQQNDFKSQKGTFQKSINNQIDAKYSLLNSDLKSEVDNYREELIETINKHKDNVEHQFKEEQANLSRLFALHCDSINSHYIASTWWLSAAENYKETGDEDFFGICIRSMKDSLKKCNDSDTKGIDIEELQSQIDRVNKTVPDIIKTDRESIVEKLNGLIDLKNKNTINKDQ